MSEDKKDCIVFRSSRTWSPRSMRAMVSLFNVIGCVAWMAAPEMGSRYTVPCGLLWIVTFWFGAVVHPDSARPTSSASLSSASHVRGQSMACSLTQSVAA